MEEEIGMDSCDASYVTGNSFKSPYNSPENSMSCQQNGNEENITPRSSNNMSQLNSSDNNNSVHNNDMQVSKHVTDMKLSNTIQNVALKDEVPPRSSEQAVLSELNAHNPLSEIVSDLKAKGDSQSQTFSKEHILINQGMSY